MAREEDTPPRAEDAESEVPAPTKADGEQASEMRTGAAPGPREGGLGLGQAEARVARRRRTTCARL